MVRAVTRLVSVAVLAGTTAVVARLVHAELPYPIIGGLAAATASVFAIRAARRAGDRRARVAWIAQSLGAALWIVAPVTWLVRERVPWLSAADIGRTGFLICALTGFWLTSRKPDPRARFRMLLDGVLGASAALILVWAAVFSPPSTTTRLRSPP